ncbi:MAG: hypothetical protein LBQ50_10095 [Planctomycetaceae bacterium]|jgi:hypothetical protein|nr:hypothetical protein [Planctomycetaceae bacterium]
MNTKCCQQNICINKSHVDTNWRWTVMRFVVATILLIAAGLKAYQLATTPLLGEGLLYARWFNNFVVEFELFFGIWLIFGLLPKLTWLASIGLFSIFAIVSFYKAISGEVSCGCFGAVTVNPWITMTFDTGVVVLLAFCRSVTAEPIILKRIFNKVLPVSIISSLLFSYLAIAMPLTWAILTYEPTTLVSNGRVVGDAKVVMLYPQEWIDKKFPLLEYTIIQADLSKGNWLVVLYGTDCTKCEKKLIYWKSNGIPVNTEGEKVALLEISGHSENALRSRFDGGPWQWGSLKQTNVWYVETPTVLKIENGIVKSVSVR